MKNLKFYQLFFIAVAACTISLYFIKENNIDMHTENSRISVQKTKKIEISDSEHNNITKEQSNTPILEPTTPSTQKQQTSSIAMVPQQNIGQENHGIQKKYIPPIVQKYSEKIPKLYRKIYEDTPGIDYNLPLDFSEEHLAYFKKLSDQGDAKGKFVYANRLWASLLDGYYKDHLIKGDMIDKQYWKNRFDEVQKLYVVVK